MPVINIPAPYGGLNNRDGNYTIEPGYASSLYNLVPGQGFLDARGPVLIYSANDVAPNDILSIWQNANGSGVFSTTTSIYQINTVIGAPLAAGFTNGLWHGNIWQGLTILCNGVNVPQIYNGTTVVPIVAAGPTLTNLYGSTTFKGRVYYWENSARVFWYAAAGAYQGALTSFDLSMFTRSDGYLVSIAPLTIDGGAGPDDMLAFLFSNGEVLVYQGDDPGSATAWQQVGRFLIGDMLGRDCWTIVGSATLVATGVGVVDLARALAVGALDNSSVVGQNFGTDNMRKTTDVNVYAGHRKLIFDAKNRILVLCIYDPATISTTGIAIIHGMDIETRGWFTYQNVAYEHQLKNVLDLYPLPTKRTTAIGLIGGLIMYGGNSKLLKGPERSNTLDLDDYYSTIFYPENYIFYCAYNPSIDFGDKTINKVITAVNVIYEETATVTPDYFECFVMLGGDTYSTTSTSNHSFNTGFISNAAHGKRINYRVTFYKKSGLKWYSMPVMFKVGNSL